MITLRNWYLSHYNEKILGRGLVSGHPKLRTDEFIHTSAVMRAGVEEGTLRMTTFSGNLYVLEPEWFDPQHREETAACLVNLGIDGDFLEHCVRAREEANARRRAEKATWLKPGELLLEVIGLMPLQALFRTPEGELREIKPQVHGTTFQEPVHGARFQKSVFITDWEGGTVDFRYFPWYIRIEPYHISDGLRTIKVRNLGSEYTLFGREGEEVVCKAGTITAIPAAEHDKEGLVSPDRMNETGLYQTVLDSGEEKQHEAKQ